MKKILLSFVLMLSAWTAASADDVPAITVKYVSQGTTAYVQALRTIGSLQFSDGMAKLILKDSKTVELGELSEISYISFAPVDENQLSTSVADNKAITITAYPNPVADHLHVEGVAEGETIRLFTSDGRLVKVVNDADIDMGGMPKGVYILQAGKAVAKIFKN